MTLPLGCVGHGMPMGVPRQSTDGDGIVQLIEFCGEKGAEGVPCHMRITHVARAK